MPRAECLDIPPFLLQAASRPIPANPWSSLGLGVAPEIACKGPSQGVAGIGSKNVREMHAHTLLAPRECASNSRMVGPAGKNVMPVGRSFLFFILFPSTTLVMRPAVDGFRYCIVAAAGDSSTGALAGYACGLVVGLYLLFWGAVSYVRQNYSVPCVDFFGMMSGRQGGMVYRRMTEDEAFDWAFGVVKSVSLPIPVHFQAPSSILLISWFTWWLLCLVMAPASQSRHLGHHDRWWELGAKEKGLGSRSGTTKMREVGRFAAAGI